MKNLRFYQAIILKAIQDNDDAPKNGTDKQLVSFAFKRFKREKDWEIEKIGQRKAAEEWFAGLALNVPYTNHDILEMANLYKAEDEGCTCRRDEKIIEKYFYHLSLAFLALTQEFGKAKK